MKTILVITDHSPAAEHASVLALILAQHVKANILLANTVKVTKNKKDRVAAGFEDDMADNAPESVIQKDNFILWNSIRHLATPEITELDISDHTENQLAGLINKRGIWMIIKNTFQQDVIGRREAVLNMQWILNKITCPLLLVPPVWQIKSLDRLTYLTDLRYCHIHVVKYLAEIAQAFEANLAVAHLSAGGMPDMMEPFASDIFNGSICSEVEYEHLSFTNIKERDPVIATDVIINGLHSDILAFTNNLFHYEEIIGKDISHHIPDYLSVPVLLFPY